MKVYIYYLNIPENPSKQINKDDLEAFSYVESMYSDNYYKRKPGAFFISNNIKRYLYAFTNNKDTAKDFEFMHDMLLFSCLEKKMDKEEYLAFSHEMEHAELKYYKIDHNDAEQMLLTKLENSIIENMYDELEVHLSNFSCLGYSFFSKKYIGALDLLLYTLYYQLNGPDSDFYDHNWSYGMTPEGYPNNQVGIRPNYLGIYYSIFKLILK